MVTPYYGSVPQEPFLLSVFDVSLCLGHFQGLRLAGEVTWETQTDFPLSQISDMLILGLKNVLETGMVNSRVQSFTAF